MNKTDKKKPRVAVATGRTREEAVGKALSLVGDDILAKLKDRVIIKPNFLSSVNPTASTQAGAVQPVIELLQQSGAATICVAEGGSRSTMLAFDNFGYRELAQKYNIEFADLNHNGFSHSFDIISSKRERQTVEYTDFITETDTIISVPVAKTHDTAGVTLSVKNMMGCLRRVHRPRMHGFKIGKVTSRAGEFVWNTLEGHPFVVKSFSGIVFGLARIFRPHNSHTTGHWRHGLLQQVGAMSENLARLGVVLMPDVAVIDAFEAMEGEGPGSSGTPVEMKAAVAGTDPVACDAVMAFMMGFDPLDIGYLTLMDERGLGVVDMDKIDIAGDDPSLLTRKFKPHSNYPVQKRWREAWSSKQPKNG